MRIISQNGNADLPYEQITIMHANDSVIAKGNGHDMQITLGKYSSMEKAYRAMEMLIEQYEKLEVFKVLACGTTEHMEKSLNYEEMVEYNQSYREMNVFQFPKDDEVEV